GLLLCAIYLPLLQLWLLHLSANYRVQSSITVNGLKNIIMGVSIHIFLIIKYFVIIERIL
ncbi:unnamed protein product, partial [Musa textilis]